MNSIIRKNEKKLSIQSRLKKIKMEVDEHVVNGLEIPDNYQPGRWNHVRKLLERSGPFCHEKFKPSPELFKKIRDTVKVLVVGLFTYYVS